jgi:hypothetical protein
MNSFPLNIINIDPQIDNVIYYSGKIMKQCIGVLNDMKYYVKEIALSLFNYLHVFIIVSFSLLGITLLFSKNKLGNILVLFYLIMIVFVFGMIVSVFALIGICIEKLITLFKQIMKLIKMEKKMKVRPIINIIVAIFEIFLFVFEFAFILGFLVILSLIIDFLYGTIIGPLFNVINELYAKSSLVAQTTTGALDSFGTMIRKGFENCN